MYQVKVSVAFYGWLPAVKQGYRLLAPGFFFRDKYRSRCLPPSGSGHRGISGQKASRGLRKELRGAGQVTKVTIAWISHADGIVWREGHLPLWASSVTHNPVSLGEIREANPSRGAAYRIPNQASCTVKVTRNTQRLGRCPSQEELKET